MKGLVLKDLYMMKSYCKLYLIFVPVFWVAGSVSEDASFMTIYPCILTAMIPVALQMHDEKERWDCYSRTLPYSPAQIVSVKYLLNLLTISINLAVILLGQSIRMLCHSGIDGEELLSLFIPGFLVSLLPTMFILPFIFRLGAEKGQFAYLLLAMLIVGVMAPTILSDESDSAPAILGILQNPVMFAMIAVAGIAILYGISWMLSIKLYTKKEII